MFTRAKRLNGTSGQKGTTRNHCLHQSSCILAGPQAHRDIQELVGVGTQYKELQHGEKVHLCVGVGGRPHHQGIAQVLKA